MTNSGSQFDASSDPSGQPLPLSGGPQSGDASADDRTVRPFLGIRFKCCRTYGRIYRNDAGTAYSGRCPKCMAAVKVPVGQGGSAARFFNAE